MEEQPKPTRNWEEKNPFFTHQLDKLKPDRRVLEMSIAINTKAPLPHVKVSVETDSSDIVCYIQTKTGCRVGHPAMINSWRSSTENYLDLAKAEIADFLDQCCFQGRSIKLLKLFADNDQKEFFWSIGASSMKHGMSVEELILDNKDSAELSDSYKVLEQFTTEVVTIVMHEIGQKHVEQLEEFTKFSTPCTYSCTFESAATIDSEVQNQIQIENGLQGYNLDVRDKEIIYWRHDFWDLQRAKVANHQEIEKLKMSVITRTLFPNICVSIRLKDLPEEQIHCLQADKGCRVGDPKDLSTWRTYDFDWLEQMQDDIGGFLRHTFRDAENETTTGKSIKKLTIFADSPKDEIWAFLRDVVREFISVGVKIQELEVDNLEAKLLESCELIEELSFSTGSMRHGSVFNMLELEAGSTKLGYGIQTFTIHYKSKISEKDREHLRIADFRVFTITVSPDFEDVVLTSKPEGEIRYA